MVPEYSQEPFWQAETTHGTEFIPCDLARADGLGLFLEGRQIKEEPVKKIEGSWFARLCAPGYLDRTPWDGPYESKDQAMEQITALYDVDPETGDPLDDLF
jgi:hypothetical protein